MDVKDATNTTQLSREGSNELSSAGEAPPVKRNWYQQLWDSFKTPGSAMQIIAAALLAIAIGLAVSTTVDDIPEAVPIILEIPGSLWLRALRATGKFYWSIITNLANEMFLLLTANHSVTLDHCRHDSCRAEPDEHGERWWKASPLHHLVVCWNNNSRNHHQHHPRRPCMASVDDGCRRRHPADD